MNCGKCGRNLDVVREMLSMVDSKYGRLCIACYNNTLIEKVEELKNNLNGLQPEPDDVK